MEKFHPRKVKVHITRGEEGKIAKVPALLGSGAVHILDFVFDDMDPPDFNKIKTVLYEIINRFESRTSIIFFNIPYCVMPDSQEHIINDESDCRRKLPGCFGCRFFGICGGIPVKSKFDIKPVPDVPKQVCIEVTRECNLNCEFCFSDKGGSMEPDDVSSVIRQAKEIGAGIVRFTGGEPMLFNGIEKHMAFAKSLGLEIWLNSNCTLIDKFNAAIARNIDSLLVPIHHHMQKCETIITGDGKSLKNKIRLIDKLRKLNPSLRIRYGTTLCNNNIDSISAIVGFTRGKLRLENEFYRQISSEIVGRENILKFHQQSEVMMSGGESRNIITNALPFCLFKDMDSARLISLGGFMDDGRDRIVVGPDGKVKSTYYSKDVVGRIGDLKSAWGNELMTNLRSLRAIPKMCSVCIYKTICMGGSRTISRNVYGSYFDPDPMVAGVGR